MSVRTLAVAASRISMPWAALGTCSGEFMRFVEIDGPEFVGICIS